MDMLTVVVLAGAAVASALVLRVVSVVDRLHLSWRSAWWRALLIVALFVVATVMLPSAVLKTELVGRLARDARDAIGVALWSSGLGAGLLGLWRANRESRI